MTKFDLMRLEQHDPAVRQVMQDLCLENGLAWNPYGESMYYNRYNNYNCYLMDSNSRLLFINNTNIRSESKSRTSTCLSSWSHSTCRCYVYSSSVISTSKCRTGRVQGSMSVVGYIE